MKFLHNLQRLIVSFFAVVDDDQHHARIRRGSFTLRGGCFQLFDPEVLARAPNTDRPQHRAYETRNHSHNVIERAHRHPRIVDLMERRVAAVNEHLPRYEQVRRFHLVPREFSQEAGEITPTLKPRRKVIEEHFRAAIETIYAAAPGGRSGEPVERAADGRG